MFIPFILKPGPIKGRLDFRFISIVSEVLSLL